MAWWQERITPDGEFLRWQEEGCIQPYVPTEKYQRADILRTPRPTFDKRNMPRRVPVCDLGYASTSN